MDTNSGAVPQPGGYAGPGSERFGHAVPQAETAGIPAPEPQDLEVELTPDDLRPEEPKAVEAEGTDPSEGDDEGEGEEVVTEDSSGETVAEESADNPAEEGDDEDDETEGDEPEVPAYDPSEHKVDEVVAYVAEYPESKDAVLAAEKAGKKRTTLIEVLEA